MKITKKMNKAFIKSLKDATVEKDVEVAYKEMLKNAYFGDNYTMSSPHDTDGYMETGMFIRLLFEAKYDKDFTKRSEQRTVLVQALYYMKRFEQAGEELPSIVMIGDKNEYFLIKGDHLYPYLKKPLDWSLAPSSAADHNSELLLEMMTDKNLEPFVAVIRDDFDFSDIKNAIDNIASNAVVQNVNMTEKNIARVYDDFLRTVVTADNIKDYDANTLVEIFILSMTDVTDTYIHPNKPNVLHLANGTEVSINGLSFYAFFTKFNRQYSPEEIKLFTGISDRLLTETKRRFQGSFWTPNIWVDKAHSMLSSVIGDDWKKRYTVWDSSCGALNLTRDYYFSSLFCSTLFPSELSIGNNYNNEAIKFQYDFLDDDLCGDDTKKYKKINIDLLECLRNKRPFVFFDNPPYAEASDKMGTKSKNKKNIASTKMKEKMNRDGVGKASNQLYAQFLWRIMDIVDEFKLEDVYIGLFSPPLLLTGNQYKKFRERFLNMFEIKQGILFNASDFADVKDSWGITFSVYKLKRNNNADKTTFNYDICQIEDNQTVIIGEKTFYNTDKVQAANEWVKKEVKNYKSSNECINLSSAINVALESHDGNTCDKSFGYILNKSNNVYENSKGLGLFTAPFCNGHGYNVVPENYFKAISYFSARALIKSDWINQKDEYLSPNEANESYEEWLYDCMVYSLFSIKSNQSALRKIIYNDRKYNVHNEWFYMGTNEIASLANKCKYVELYNSAQNATDSYVYDILKKYDTKLSPEAKNVLKLAREITKMLIEKGYRKILDASRPKYNLSCWNAGWYQQKLILKEYKLSELDDFNKKLSILENKMRPMVYKLGFLKK